MQNMKNEHINIFKKLKMQIFISKILEKNEALYYSFIIELKQLKNQLIFVF